MTIMNMVGGNGSVVDTNFTPISLDNPFFEYHARESSRTTDDTSGLTTNNQGSLKTQLLKNFLSIDEPFNTTISDEVALVQNYQAPTTTTSGSRGYVFGGASVNNLFGYDGNFGDISGMELNLPEQWLIHNLDLPDGTWRLIGDNIQLRYDTEDFTTDASEAVPLDFWNPTRKNVFPNLVFEITKENGMITEKIVIPGESSKPTESSIDTRQASNSTFANYSIYVFITDITKV